MKRQEPAEPAYTVNVHLPTTSLKISFRKIERMAMLPLRTILVSASVLAVVPVAYAQGGSGFNAGAAQVPPQGTYDHYNGPGATVLKKGLEAQHEPGVAEELAPDAKQTATGGPSGGLPGKGGR